MTHHSGKQAHDVIGKSLFEIFQRSLWSGLS